MRPLFKLKRETLRIARRMTRKITRRHKPPTGSAPASPVNIDFTAIEERYAQTDLARMPDTFALWRIIGNDLVPRHRKGQSRDNVAFILKHESQFPNCSKHWLLNRIYDPDEEAAIIALLEQHNQSYRRIEFDFREYAKQPLDLDTLPEALRSLGSGAFGPRKQSKLETRFLRHKNNYAMNSNSARNTALSLGRRTAKWVLPWDGNCFVTDDGWESIQAAVTKQPFLPYFIVPMARITENTIVLKDKVPPATEEPQIIFRCDAEEMFDERFPYGRRPKVELLWRLGIPGIWDRYIMEPFDLPRPALARQAYQYAQAGWVARLSSGAAQLETGNNSARRRDQAREEAIIQFLDLLDRVVAQQGENHGPQNRSGILASEARHSAEFGASRPTP